MSVTRSRIACASGNAFRPSRAVWALFVEPQSRPRFSKEYTSSTRSSQDAEANTTASDLPAASTENSQLLIFTVHPASTKERYRQLVSRRRKSDHIKQVHVECIDPSSVAKTLELHRDKNRSELIHTVKVGPSAGCYRPELPNAARKVEEPKDEQKGTLDDPEDLWFKHLNIETAGATPKAKKILKSMVNDTTPLEYEGQYVLPNIGRPVPATRLPWMQGLSHSRGFERLSEEINGFAKYIVPTPRERLATEATIQGTRDLVHEVLPHCRTEVFGSYRTGLTLLSSDIDIRLFRETASETEANMAPRFNVRKLLLRDLVKLNSAFYAHPHFRMSKMRYARYPLVTAQHTLSRIDLQVVSCNDTSRSRELIKRYLEEDKDLFPIYAVLKTALEIRGLTDVYRGGVGSYTLVMMIVAALKLGTSTEGDSVGHKLCAVLKFYTNLNTYKTAISIEPPFLAHKRPLNVRLPEAVRDQMEEDPVFAGLCHISSISPFQPYSLVLQDPADPLNDLGHKSYGIKHIQTTLAYLRGLLEHSLKSQTSEGSLLSPLVGHCYEAFRLRRKTAEAYAAQLEAGKVDRKVSLKMTAGTTS
ncbi:hypothetical protein EJ06DRAFT_342348 [Trichodelitschia bisporula]|uniref:Poly(A) RNA polymerase mitochondrial-like central palm domain-containing protein n=1 Tax=Trichodelitschia bisporula TaxID=703511 RepID=A0A6G1I365_9PEZI|nr:hypothetical protein EJ06DRAFT_342348 [Trichodelitschia bisporula]